MNIHIRKARTSETKLLTDLAMTSKSVWGYSEEFMQGCREELSVSHVKISNPKFHYYVAESINEVLGFYALEILDDSKIELEALFVYPQYIGKGIGKALMNHAKMLAIELDAKKMIIQGDPNAESFYLAAGAKRVGEKESGSIKGRFLPFYEILL